MAFGTRMGLLAAILSVPLLPAVLLGQDFELGASVGTSGATAETNFDGEEALSGFTAGFFLRLGLSDVVGLQAGSRWVQKGVGFDDGSEKIKFTYLEQPILAVFRAKGSRLTGSLQAGGAFAREVGCKVEFLGSSEDCDSDAERRKWDYSLVAGGDVGLMFGDGFTVALALQYIHGLREISKSESEASFKNRAATLELTLSKLLGS